MSAVAIAYVMQKTTHVFPIIGGRKVEQLEANLEALNIKLTDEQIQYLENASPFDIGFPLNFIVSLGMSPLSHECAAHTTFLGRRPRLHVPHEERRKLRALASSSGHHT